MLTVIITSISLLAVALLKNEELQNRLLNLGKTANCILNITTNNLEADNDDPDSMPVDPEPANWNNFFNFLLKLSNSCAALNQSNH